MIKLVRGYILPAALSLLPARMDSPAARAMLVAIGLQESRFEHRRQIGGPARGFPQFERGSDSKGGGIVGVLRHAASGAHLLPALDALRYPPDADALYDAIEHNDVLACVLARLLLFTLPYALPGAAEPDEGWRQYLEAWRPGRPHRATWDAFYAQAWGVVSP